MEAAVVWGIVTLIEDIFEIEIYILGRGNLFNGLIKFTVPHNGETRNLEQTSRREKFKSLLIKNAVNGSRSSVEKFCLDYTNFEDNSSKLLAATWVANVLRGDLYRYSYSATDLIHSFIPFIKLRLSVNFVIRRSRQLLKIAELAVFAFGG